jgi:hypothetical protein
MADYCAWCKRKVEIRELVHQIKEGVDAQKLIHHKCLEEKCIIWNHMMNQLENP